MFAGMTKADVALALELAENAAEVDAAAHLSLLLFEHRGCTEPVTRPDSRQMPSLHQLVRSNRGRFASRSHADRRLDQVRLDVDQQRRAERAAIKHDREERIRQLGINNVR